ncbi:MAG: peptide-methionine (S)-S-oxide reductase MsrA [Bacteroidales bacterium]|nr:peptide-methionine (S)-S-oxide reductase MsrA [Bacteroidales bacterium]
MERMNAQTDKIKETILGSGCFWCTEAIFQMVKGIVEITPGYSGGHIKNPSYREVCDGNTGHAEVIKLVYNETIISFSEILEIFFKTHDPTQLNGQGADIGEQYRSVIFYLDSLQEQTAKTIIAELDNKKIWDKKIVTAVEPYKNFYKAEDYHHNYYSNNPNQGYCRFVITPKIEKFEKVFRNYTIRE